MRLRQIILFLLILLVPLAAVAWLGLKVARDEQRVSQHQFRVLLDGRLRDVDSTIGRVVAAAERQLLERVLTADRVPVDGLDETGIAALRQIRRSQPLVREVFAVDSRGVLVFPPAGEQASAEERAFRERTAAIWSGQAVLYEPPSPERANAAQSPPRPPPTPEDAQSSPSSSPPRPSPSSSRPDSGNPERERRPGALSDSAEIRGDTVLALAASRDSGWITWYWEEGLHLLLWRRATAGGVIGVEVERVALLAQIVSALPASDLDDGRVALVDSRGASIHQWGPHNPEPEDGPTVTMPVRYPLSAWRLHHFASPEQRRALAGGGIQLNLILGLAAVALGLLALALVFYRDYARRMREAAQRVGFVTQVSHELKTPLTNIRLYAELLDDDLDGLLAAVAAGDSDDHGDSSSDEDDAIRGRTAVIIAESQRLTRLINNILTFSKQRRGQLDLRLERVAVRALVDQVLAQFGPALQARGIAAEIAVPDDLTVYADRDALGQIIANLLSNVDKYAAAGGRVEIAAGRRGARAWLRVSDRGPGIPAAHRDKIFRPFYRMSDKLADGVTGTGIGLAIARELARRLGGELRLVARDECGEHDAQSERDGASTSGACFELELDSADEPGQGERS